MVPVRTVKNSQVIPMPAKTDGSCSHASTRKKLKNTIHKMQCEHKRMSFEKKDEVANWVFCALKTQGNFIKNFQEQFYLFTESGKLIDISPKSRDLQAMLNREFSLNSTESVTKFVLEQLRNHAHTNSDEVQIHSFAKYDKKENCVFLDLAEGKVLRISADMPIEIVSYSLETTIFRPDNFSSTWTYIPKEERDSEISLDNLYFNTIPVSDENKKQSFILLLKVFFFSIFFPELMQSKPIMAFTGEKGCGKSTALRSFGQILFGEKFNVSANITEPKDLEVAAVNLSLVAIDNLDGSAKKILDLAATTATGGVVTKRSLFTDDTLYNRPLRASIAVTSRTLHFKREDIASRLLRIDLKPIESRIAQSTIQDKITENRDSLMSEVSDTLQRILQELEKTKDELILVSTRMADFAVFAIRIAPALGSDKEQMLSCLNIMTNEQSEYIREGNSFLDTISDWFDKGAGIYGMKYLPSELFKSLSEFADDYKYKLNIATPTVLGKRIKEHRVTLEKEHGLYIHKRGQHTGYYMFELEKAIE